MALLFHKILTPLARAWKVRSRERSLSYDLQTTQRARLRAQASYRTQAAQASPEPALPRPLQEAAETAPLETRNPAPQAPVTLAPPDALASLGEELEVPPTMSESDLVSLAQALDLEELLRSPLGRAIQRYLTLRYPHLQEYEDLILAEAGDLLHTDLGRQLVVVDPGEFVEAAVRRAMITVAEIRVSLRQAVRSRLAGQRLARPSEQVAETSEQAAIH